MALPPSPESVWKGLGRLTCQEALSLIYLPDRTADDGRPVKRFMSRRRVWCTGEGIYALAVEQEVHQYKLFENAYGGHVYAQSALAASLTLRAVQNAAGGRDKGFGIHSIHGFFSEPGLRDRPYIYEVAFLASNAAFPNLLVTMRQPTSPSSNPKEDFFPESDAAMPLGPVCFSAMISFRPSGFSQLDAHEPPPQERFADILRSRRPMEWAPAPVTDVDGTLALIKGSRRAVGIFPILEMRKVDMRAYNASRPMHERRELLLYRLLAPLPATITGSGTATPGEECEVAGPNAHICAHAYGADRNGLLMMGNHAGFGFDMARAATLSYSFVVHVNPADAVMTYSEGDDQWWVQEMCFPRVQAGRGIVHCKIWSPSGAHVATELQDGMVRRKPRPGDEKAKPGDEKSKL